MKKNKKMNHIVVVISGGVLQSVYVSSDLNNVDIELVDFDNMEANGLNSDQRDAKMQAAIKGLKAIW